MIRMRVFFIAAAVMIICALALPGPAAAMGGKPDNTPKVESKAESRADQDQSAANAAAPETSAMDKAAQAAAGSETIGGRMAACMEGGPVHPGGAGVSGGQVTAVMNSSGSGMSALNPGGMNDVLSSAGGMAAPSGWDGFPPFFGDNGVPQTSGQRNVADGAQALLGTWSAPNGQYTLSMIFRPGGVCALIDKGQQVPGTYEVQGNLLNMRFANGQNLSLTFSMEGDFLVLSDGSRLQRQPDGQQQAGQQPVPQPVPQPMPQPQAAQGLEGAWAVSSHQGMVIMMFMNGMCGLNANGRQLYGPYTVQGNHLHVQFMNARPLDVDFTVEGDTLRFSDGTVLRRQQMPNMPGGGQPIQQQPMPGGPQPQPTQQPMPPQAGGATSLEGAWATQLPNGVHLVFVFTGGQYRVLANGQPTETGIFTLNGDRLEYTTTSGQQPGQKGVNRWQLNGDTLIMTLPDGTSVQFGRQRQ